MAFDKTKFGRLSADANSDIPTIWGYSTPDDEAAVEAAGYFNDVSDHVNVGDRILLHLDTDGSDTSEETWVTANANGVVTIQGLTALAAD